MFLLIESRTFSYFLFFLSSTPPERAVRLSELSKTMLWML